MVWFDSIVQQAGNIFFIIFAILVIVAIIGLIIAFFWFQKLRYKDDVVIFYIDGAGNTNIRYDKGAIFIDGRTKAINCRLWF